jgi:hypothetical protein
MRWHRTQCRAAANVCLGAASAFVAACDRASLADILCIEEQRIVARGNTVTYRGRKLRLPQSPARPHYVKARVKMHE